MNQKHLYEIRNRNARDRGFESASHHIREDQALGHLKIHAGHIEVAVAYLLNYRRNCIVPNVSYGLYLNHECDMLVLDDRNRFTEIEIKVTIADLRADFKKTHGHHSRIISRLVYAVPYDILEKALPLIPMHCGIITVKAMTRPLVGQHFTASWYRHCRHRVDQKPGDKIIRRFMELGCMRIWSLKQHNNKRQ